MDLTPFKCFVCKILPEEDVYMCSNKHINCIQCAKELQNTCRCLCDLKLCQNPLECALLNVNANCIFKSNGCTWMFAVKDLHEHLGECKYRPYICIGKKLNVTECSWEGLKHQIVDHFTKSHCSRKMYSYSEEDKVLFDKKDEKIVSAINLVDAFNKTFVFYYESNRDSNTISMIIYLLGRKQDAKKYLYEIEIWNELDRPQRIKFIQSCYSDADDILDLIKCGKCVSISDTVIKNYLLENEIYFRFRMHKRDPGFARKSVSCTNLNTVKNQTKGSQRQPTENNQPRRQHQPANGLPINIAGANYRRHSGVGWRPNIFPIHPQQK